MTNETKQEAVFPWITMSFLCLGMLAHSVVFTAPLPYVAFMVYDFGMATDLDKAGYTAGWITGMFMIGRTVSSIPWGIVSDKWGRKPCLVASMFNVALFGTLFGFSQSFTVAVSMRFLLGIGNGFMAIAKTVITEIVHCKEHEIRAFGYLNGIWGLGLIVGPAVGGLFARPVVQYPSYFSPTGLWGRYPYLLPSLICAAIAVIAGVGLLLFLPETLVIKKTDTSNGMIELTNTNTGNNYGWSILRWNQSKFLPLQNEEITSDSTHDSQHNPLENSSHPMIPLDIDELVDEPSTELSSDEEIGIETEEAGTPKVPLPASLQEILLNTNIQLLFLIYMGFCFTIMFVDESFPLWCVSSIYNGGLNWESAQVGETLAGIGLGLVFFQLFLYEYTMKTFFNYDDITTIVKMFHRTSIAIMVLPILTDIVLRISLKVNPSVNTKTDPWIYAAILLCWLCYRIPATGAFSTLAMLVNRSVDPSMRGTMNGLIMTAGSLGNGAGPIIGSTIYALAITLVYGNHQEKNDHTAVVLPIDGRIVFILGGLLIIFLARVVKLYLIS